MACQQNLKIIDDCNFFKLKLGGTVGNTNCVYT